MYQALYRKYRPQTFEDVIGQEHITRSLKNQVETGRLSHAYIFIGTRGTGKTTCARILAKAVNCEHPVHGNPCGECASCRGIAEGSVMDIVELDAASNNGVDNVRALRDEAVFSPASVKKRVYIIDEVHMLSTPAFNALLKILEEPPEHLIFVLATTELQKVPATILSRCQRHSFKRIPTETLAAYLEDIAVRESISLSHEAALLLAGLGEGSCRDAMSMLDQCSSYGTIGTDEVYSALGLAGNRRISSLYSHVLRCDAAAALTEFDSMWKEGKDSASVIRELMSLNRDVMLVKLAPEESQNVIYGGYEKAALQQFAAAPLSLLIRNAEILSDALAKLQNPKNAAELAIIKMAVKFSEEELAVRSPEKAEAAPAPAPVSAPARTVAPAEARKTEAPSVKSEAPAPVHSEALPAEQESSPASSFWQELCTQVKGDIPFDIALQLNDPTVVTGKLEGDTLVLSVQPGFRYDRFNRPEVLDAFRKAATALRNSDVSVRMTTLAPPKQELRDLSELEQFSEIKFI